MSSDDSYSEHTPGQSDEQSEAAGGPPNEGAPGHVVDPDVAGPAGERDAGRPNEGAPGHEPDD